MGALEFCFNTGDFTLDVYACVGTCVSMRTDARPLKYRFKFPACFCSTFDTCNFK